MASCNHEIEKTGCKIYTLIPRNQYYQDIVSTLYSSLFGKHKPNTQFHQLVTRLPSDS